MDRHTTILQIFRYTEPLRRGDWNNSLRLFALSIRAQEFFGLNAIPDDLCQLLVRLIDNYDFASAYSPNCGFGLQLAELNREARRELRRLQGVEKNQKIADICAMALYLSGCKQFAVENGDALLLNNHASSYALILGEIPFGKRNKAIEGYSVLLSREMVESNQFSLIDNRYFDESKKVRGNPNSAELRRDMEGLEKQLSGIKIKVQKKYALLADFPAAENDGR